MRELVVDVLRESIFSRRIAPFASGSGILTPERIALVATRAIESIDVPETLQGV